MACIVIVNNVIPAGTAVQIDSADNVVAVDPEVQSVTVTIDTLS
jgi:hypothetical protein